MKIPVLTLVCVLGFAALKGQAQESTRSTIRDPKVNVGIKAGFNSSMYFLSEFSVGGKELINIQNNYKIGYLGALFCQFNLKKHHFIQTEISYNISNGSIYVPHIKDNTSFLSGNGLVKTRIHSIDLPVLYGYKFIDVYPYGMSFFIGPKVAYIWNKHSKNEHSGFYQEEIVEKLYPLYFSGVIGLAVNVGNIFFDFRYEAGLHNITKSIVYNKELTQAPYNEHDISLKRTRNVLSFSLGVIF